MTLPLNTRVSSMYLTDGTQKDFGFGFRVFYDPDNGGYGIEVRKVTDDGYEIIPKANYIVLPIEDNTAGIIRFHVAPAAGDTIYLAGNTPTIQQLNLTNYGRFSAESIEAQFDFLTAIIQEWISSLGEETAQRINGDLGVKEYTDQLYSDWQAWAEANVPTFAETYLDAEISDFRQQWTDAMNSILTGRVPALVVDTSSGQTQQEINDFGGAKWWPKPGGYAAGDSVYLDTGVQVRSTVSGNLINPNVSMAGWTLKTDAEIITWSGRSLLDRSKDFVTDKDYGAIGDGVYHPLSERFATLALAKFAYSNIESLITSLTQSIDWAAAQSAIKNHKAVFITAGFRIINDTIDIPPGHGFISLEKPATDPNGAFISGSAFLFYGTGPKRYIAPTLGDNVYQTANPNVGAVYLGDSGTRGNVYKLQNFNENFSAAIILNAGSYVDRVAVLCYHAVGGNGISGYTAANSGAVADPWDVGIWARNCSHWMVSNVFGRGQFRKAGLLISASQLAGGPTTVANDGWIVENSIFAGGAGLSIRSDNVAPGGFTNYGFGNGSFINCQFHGFAHQSNHLATSSYLTAPLDRPSACIELNGIENKPRGIDFYSCTIFGRDDISIFSGYANEIKFIGCYQESKGLRIGGTWTANTEGSRMVVSADSSLQFIGHSKYGVDFTPNFQRDNGVIRYGATLGCFSTNSISSDDDYENFKFVNSTGFRLRRNSGVWAIADYNNDAIFSVDADGDVSANRSFTAGGILYFKGGIENTVNGGATSFKRANGSGVMDTYLWVSGTNVNVSFYGNITPNTDNTQTLGSSGSRWSVIYAGTATINTSDARLKQDFRGLTDLEKSAALDIKDSIGIFKFKDAVAQKGDGARDHVGVLAQAVVTILESYDLNPFDYAFVCYDEWEEEPEVIETWDQKVAHDDIYNDDGELIHRAGDVIREAGAMVVKDAVPAGNSYGIRYEELIMFILAAI